MRACWSLVLVQRILSSGLAFAGEGPSNARMHYGWSRYRYVRYDKEPHPQDQSSAILAGGDVKCDVCQVIVEDVVDALLRKHQSELTLDEETILEALEADYVDEDLVDLALPEMERYVELNRRGCNKLFKDSFLSKGWLISECHRLAKGQNVNTPVEHRAPWACARQSKVIPNATNFNTYSVQNEAIHHACESTVGEYRDALSVFIATRLQKVENARHEPQLVRDVVTAGCRDVAKCLKRKPSETAEARVKELEDRMKRQDGELDAKLSKLEKSMKGSGKHRKQKRRKAEL